MTEKTDEIDEMAMLDAAQQRAQANVIRDRIALIRSTHKLKRIHGTDDYERSVKEILEQTGSEGVAIPILRLVHSDSKKLDDVIAKMKEAGTAKEEKVGKTPILKAA